jgi:hypothetical protein
MVHFDIIKVNSKISMIRTEAALTQTESYGNPAVHFAYSQWSAFQSSTLIVIH